MHKPAKILLGLLLATLFAFPAGAGEWNLVLLITTDIQGQLEPFDVKVKQGTKMVTMQVGGVSRLAWAMDRARTKFPGMTLTVSSGDDFLGPYAYYFGADPISAVMGRLEYDISAMGNHDFDHGDAFLAESLQKRGFPVVVSNLVVEPASPLYGLTHPYKVVSQNNLKIGFFGLINEDLAIISSPSPQVKAFSDFTDISAKMVRILKQYHRVDLVVALAHIGIQSSRELARQVPEIDVICVGDASTLVERGREMVVHADGQSSIVVQTGLRGEYLGLLKLHVAERRIQRYHWQPIRMGDSITEDPITKNLVADHRRALPDDTIVARAKVPLDLRKRSLRTGESPFGNLVADIIRERFQTDLSFYNSGLIRGDKTVPAGEISTSDLSKMFPFSDSIHLLRLSGTTLKQVLERSVSALPEAKGWFLQVSGLRYTVKISKMPQKLNIGADGRAMAVAEVGKRVLGIEVLNSNGKYYPLDPDKIYSVATNGFIALGGDGYIMLKAIQERQDSSIPLKDVVTEGLRRRKEIELATFHRIVFLVE